MYFILNIGHLFLCNNFLLWKAWISVLLRRLGFDVDVSCKKLHDSLSSKLWMSCNFLDKNMTKSVPCISVWLVRRWWFCVEEKENIWFQYGRSFLLHFAQFLKHWIDHHTTSSFIDLWFCQHLITYVQWKMSMDIWWIFHWGVTTLPCRLAMIVFV